MDKGTKIVDSLSRRAKINIFAVIFLVFIVLITLSSINPVTQMIENRKKISELEEKLNWLRNNNIELLALEKSLYKDEVVEMEAREQFNMVKDGELNFRVVEKDQSEEFKGAEDPSKGSNKGTDGKNLVYSNCDLWGNIKIFYNEEIKK